MLKPDEEQSFFDRERDRLTGEIATVRFFFGVLQDHMSATSLQRFFFFFFSFPLRDSKNYYRAAIC